MLVVGDSVIGNREGIEPFGFRWCWARGDATAGFTAVVRVKNEARNLPFVLPQLLRSVERVVLVDNQSSDRTAEVAGEIASRLGRADRLEVVDYPFDVARCGSEHRETPPDSVHSLTYFNNWAFSHVRTMYALKWDGDMVLSEEGERVLRDLAWRLEGVQRVVAIPRHAVYVRSDTEAWVDALVNREPWAWPNLPGYRFGKGLEWEVPLTPGGISGVRLPDFVCFEVKWLDKDEFNHWSSPGEFEGSVRQSRKRREWALFQALVDGQDPEGLVRVTSASGEHVIDTVRSLTEHHWTARVEDQPSTGTGC